MGAYWSKLRAQDPDQLFGYSTYKVVRVKDRYLGILYYVSTLAIFAYILSSIATQKLYLKKASPTAGFIRASARLTPNPALTPAYCTVPPPLDVNNNFGGCLHWAAEQIAYPYDGELDTLFLTTRVTVAQTPPPSGTCSNYFTDPDCAPPAFSQLQSTQAVTTYYIANVENISIQVDHGVLLRYSSSYNSPGTVTKSSKDMDGRMAQLCNDNAKPRDPTLIWNAAYRNNGSTTNHLDTFTLGQIVGASNCAAATPVPNLDTPSGADGAKRGETLRSSGFVISAPIIYNGDNNKGVAYSYVPAQINGTEYKVTQTIVQPDNSIVYIVRHGIRIVFVQTGEIGQFDFMTLLQALVAATALLRVASLIVETLMLWVMPHRHLYDKAKFESTADFSDIRDEQEDAKRQRKLNFMTSHSNKEHDMTGAMTTTTPDGSDAGSTNNDTAADEAGVSRTFCAAAAAAPA
ncbi:cytochrome c oxidase subunit 1 [Geranomyces michiganensis]|nr:cytochrome c oxidase subunit 1 [Geranomyces michiganensis]